MGKGQVTDRLGTGKGPNRMGQDRELDNSVCPHPFQRTKEGRWVMDWYGTGKGLVWDG